jgi:hypothetical protein
MNPEQQYRSRNWMRMTTPRMPLVGGTGGNDAFGHAEVLSLVLVVFCVEFLRWPVENPTTARFSRSGAPVATGSSAIYGCKRW